MSISYDTSTGGTVVGTTLTYSHTCTGTNRILFVVAATGSITAVSGATYNGVAMTRLEDVAVGGLLSSSLFYLKNPASGAHNVVVSGGTTSISAVSASYADARGDSGLDTTPGGTFANPGSTINVSTTTSADNCWAVAGGLAAADTVTSGNGSTTVRQSSASIYGPYICDTNGVVHPAGSVTLKINCTNEKVTMSMASFRPPVINTLTLTETQASTDAILTNYRRFFTFTETQASTEAYSYKTNRFRGSVSKSSAPTWSDATKHTATPSNTAKSSPTWANPSKTK